MRAAARNAGNIYIILRNVIVNLSLVPTQCPIAWHGQLPNQNS